MTTPGPRLVGIHVAPSAGAPMEARRRVATVTGAGLDGDRYRRGIGTYSGSGYGPRDVTLIERETLDALRAESGRLDVGDPITPA